MIALRRLNNQEVVLNADFIETVESTPDTIISLTNGKKYIVKNPVEDVVRKAVRYKQLCHQTLRVVTSPKPDGTRASTPSRNGN